MMECLFSGRLYNSGDHDQLKGEKYKITLCWGNSNLNICVTARNKRMVPVSSMTKFAEFHCRNDLKLMIFKRRSNAVQQSNVLEHHFLCEENVNLSAEFFQHTLLER